MCRADYGSTVSVAHICLYESGITGSIEEEVVVRGLTEAHVVSPCFTWLSPGGLEVCVSTKSAAREII